MGVQMARKKNQTKGVFCLEESAWFGIKDKTSVEPMLRLLETTKDYQVPYLRFDVGTREEFDFYLKKWSLKAIGESHPILYLGFHGESRGISVGEGRENLVPLSDLAERLDDKCKGRVIHFGSCATFDVHGNTLSAFLRRTSALAVCGYREDVDWMEAAAFDLMLLGGLQWESFLRRDSMEKFADSLIRNRAPGLARTLGFQMKVNPG